LRHVFRLAALAAAVVTSAACGRSGDLTSSRTDAATALVGPTWRLASLEGHAVVPGSRVTAVFGEDGRVSGSAGCNAYTGRAIPSTGRLEVGLMATTMMYCNLYGVMPQEQAYLALLEKATAYRLDGRLLQLGPAPGVATLVFTLE
jgi:heat shock protein HslJ